MDNEIFEALLEILLVVQQPKAERQLLQTTGDNLEPAALPVMIRIAQYPGISVGELAEQVGRHHSSVSRQVDRLVKAGWVVETDRSDRRIRRLDLSEHGQRVWVRLKMTQENIVKQRLTAAGYTAADQRQLAAALQRLALTLTTPPQRPQKREN